MKLKRYVLLENNTILSNYEELQNGNVIRFLGFTERKEAFLKSVIKTSDNILDLVEPCKLWDLNGDLYEYAIDDFVFIEKVYDDTDFSTKEVKAIYKRQANGDYKRYEVL